MFQLRGERTRGEEQGPECRRVESGCVTVEMLESQATILSRRPAEARCTASSACRRVERVNSASTGDKDLALPLPRKCLVTGRTTECSGRRRSVH